MKHIPSNILSAEDKEILGADITLEEIEQSLKKMKPDSTPGIDGLNAQFYTTFWQEIKAILLKTYLHAFQSGSLSITQRQGINRLIPKKNKNPWFVSSWWPITLLNVDYKILTKLFAERLSLFLPDLIHWDQRGFVKGRSIHDNLLDVHAMIAKLLTSQPQGHAAPSGHSKSF